MLNYDVIVVGAGPAGSSAAYFLGTNRIRTLLLDKSDFPRSKLCSGGLSPRALKTLDEMSFTTEIEGNYQRIEGVRFISPNRLVVEGQIPKNDRYRSYGYVINRKTLDDKLRRHAIEQGGAEYRTAEVVDFLFDKTQVAGIKVKSGEEIYSKVVVLASGVHSPLAEKHNVICLDTALTMTTLEGWRERVKSDDKILIYFHEKLLPGYFWVFPEGFGAANVGFGTYIPRARDFDMPQLLENITRSGEIATYTSGSMVSHKPKGWPIKFRKPDEFPIGNNVIAVGDAGGFANPFTGEGIYYALESGKFAAMAIKEALNTGNTTAHGLRLFKDLCKSEFDEDIEVSYKLRNAAETADFLDGLIDAASKDRDINALLQGTMVNVIPKNKIMRLMQQQS